MSINDKNYGRGKILMLALMMVTSTFAVIGTTTATPSGNEWVIWGANNGVHTTNADGSHVYVYDNNMDAVYDFNFTSDGLEVGETYQLIVELWNMSSMVLEHEFNVTWDGNDYDGDGAADASSEYLVDGMTVELLADGHCYDAVGILMHVAPGETYSELDHISQLIGIGTEDCPWFGDEYLTVNIVGDYWYDVDVPIIMTAELSGLDTECEDPEADIECPTYYLNWSVYRAESANVESELIHESWEELDHMTDFFDMHIANPGDGCFYVEAEFSGLDEISYTQQWFDVGMGCSEVPEPTGYAWVYVDKSFDMEMDMLEWYEEGDQINIHYGATGLVEAEWYHSVVQIHGPHDMMEDDHHHEGITFYCGDGSEIPFDWVNDGEQDCEDGADEQQYDADGNPINWFDCHNGDEIWISQVNDGNDDCPHGEDEGEHHEEHHEEGGDDNLGGEEDGGTQASSADGRHCVPEGEVCHEEDDGEGDHDHDGDDTSEDPYCYDMSTHTVIEDTNKEDCESNGYMWVEDDGGDHGDDEEPVWEFWDNGTADALGELEGWVDLSSDELEPGIYSVSYIVMQYDANGMPNMMLHDVDIICVVDMRCSMAGGGGGHYDLHPENYATGEAYFNMHFDQYEGWEAEDGTMINGVLELYSAEMIDPSYRMFADMNADGEVDAMEAMEFVDFLMNNDGQPEECPFDKDHPDSPCNVEECSPEGYTEEGCHTAIEEYCANNDDPACMDTCPFDMNNEESPCYAEECEDHESEACMQYAESYCAENPQDEGCHDDGEGEHDHDHDGDGGTEASSADGRHCVPEGEVCPEDGGEGDHDHDGDGEGDHDHNHDHGDGDGDHDDGHLEVELDGVKLGKETFNWVWLENLIGPVDSNEPVIYLEGMVWDLSLPDWETTEEHTITLTNSDDRPLLSPCDDDPESGAFSVYDSWSWSPLEPDLGDWNVEADGEHGWVSTFDCNSEPLDSLSVTFVKTIKDYNADNLEGYDEGPQNDYEQDMQDNLPPECHVFLTSMNSNNYSEAEEHFSAPNGDHTVELAPGDYYLWASCHDPEGDMVWASISAGGVHAEFLEESHGEGSVAFTMMAGMPAIEVEYHWDSSGGQSGSGVITISVIAPADNNTDVVEPTTNDDGTLSCPDGLVLNADSTQCIAPGPDNIGDIVDDVVVEEEGGAIPGFTTALSVISMLGAVLVMSRRKQD